MNPQSPREAEVVEKAERLLKFFPDLKLGHVGFLLAHCQEEVARIVALAEGGPEQPRKGRPAKKDTLVEAIKARPKEVNPFWKE